MNFNWKNFLKNETLVRSAYLIDNNWRDDLEKKLEVVNPANQEIISYLPFCSAPATQEAINSSQSAFERWSTTLASERSNFLLKWANLMKANQRDLAIIMTLEQGKPLKESIGEVLYAASFLEWFAEEGKRIYGETIPSHKKSTRIVIQKQPVGVVGIITPWNFPLAMITRKVAPALASGCTCVVKPAESTPLSAIALISLALKAGMEKGVVNLIFGDYEAIGKELTSNPVVKKISFTGSTPTGKFLLKQSSSTIKRVSLELGGNAPFIIFKDADLNLALEGAMVCKFRNTGQTCVCANRFYIEKEIYDEFTKLLKKKVTTLKVGNGLEENVEQGPLIDKNAFLKVQEHIEDAVKNGSKIIEGGNPIKNELGGYFHEPTILTEVNEKCLINHEETFGPVAPLIPFESEEEVIRLANATSLGLASYFYTKDLSRAWRVAEALEVGMVGINEGIISSAAIPFGGVKESGIGREGSYYGINEYLNIKYILMGI